MPKKLLKEKFQEKQVLDIGGLATISDIDDSYRENGYLLKKKCKIIMLLPYKDVKKRNTDLKVTIDEINRTFVNVLDIKVKTLNYMNK